MALFPKSSASNFKTILEHLCHLEINTILKDSMTAAKMPVPELALVDLAELYLRKLVDVGQHVELPARGGPLQYKAIYDSAVELLTRLNSTGVDTNQDSDYWLVARIRDNASQIQQMFRAVTARTGKPVPDVAHDVAETTPIELLADEIVMLRKAWELGVEEVAMQTIIQLDGDVIHRVQPKYATGNHTALFAVHQSAVQTSVSYWKTLIDLIGDVVGGIARVFGLKA
jgi:hypothetical protein